MKDLTNVEAFEIIARRVNKLFNVCGDELDTALAELNDVDMLDLDEHLDEDFIKTSTYSEAIVCLCDIQEFFWNGLKNGNKELYKTISDKMKESN